MTVELTRLVTCNCSSRSLLYRLHPKFRCADNQNGQNDGPLKAWERRAGHRGGGANDSSTAWPQTAPVCNPCSGFFGMNLHRRHQRVRPNLVGCRVGWSLHRGGEALLVGSRELTLERCEESRQQCGLLKSLGIGVRVTLFAATRKWIRTHNQARRERQAGEAMLPPFFPSGQHSALDAMQEELQGYVCAFKKLEDVISESDYRPHSSSTSPRLVVGNRPSDFDTRLGCGRISRRLHQDEF